MSLRETKRKKRIIMDEEDAGVSDVTPSVCRVAVKLQSLQRRCHLDLVSLRHVTAAVGSVGGASGQQEVGLSRQKVTRALSRMLESVSQEVGGHVTPEAPEEACDLMFRLSDQRVPGFISPVSLQTFLIVLSSENLKVKYRALVSLVSGSGPGSVSRSGFRSLLQDLSQVPAALQEDVSLGGVEVAMSSCFNVAATTSRKRVMSWLRGEPRLLLWLPALHRLAASHNVTHNVRCHTCSSVPIVGLRYRCRRCVNVHVCHTCFLSERHTRKHTLQHRVCELHTQPTWKESLSSLVSSARHALLPRRSSQRRRVLTWAEPAETEDRAPPPSHSDPPVTHDASCSSKALQTDDDPQLTESLLTEIRELQRDRRVMEQQLQVWRLTVQSEQSVLEVRCSDMEVTMETLREHNLQLQQALNKMEAQQSTENVTENMENMMENIENSDPDTSEEEDEDLQTSSPIMHQNVMENVTENADSAEEEDELQTSSPTMHQDMTENMENVTENSDHDSAEEEDELQTSSPIMHQDTASPDWCLQPESEEEGDCGSWSAEELLLDTVERLKTEMKTDGWTERQTDEKRAELVQAAEQVEVCVHQLLDRVSRSADQRLY